MMETNGRPQPPLLTLTSHKGRHFVFNFQATNCPPNNPFALRFIAKCSPRSQRGIAWHIVRAAEIKIRVLFASSRVTQRVLPRCSRVARDFRNSGLRVCASLDGWLCCNAHPKITITVSRSVKPSTTIFLGSALGAGISGASITSDNDQRRRETMVAASLLRSRRGFAVARRLVASSESARQGQSPPTGFQGRL